FSNTSGANLKVHGSLTLVAGMTLNHPSPVNFEALTNGNTITTAGKTFTGSLNFNGPSGEWILQDALVGSSSIYL
ncbi:hypothetical protein ABXZ28_13135, partial [Streptococcus suis]